MSAFLLFIIALSIGLLSFFVFRFTKTGVLAEGGSGRRGLRSITHGYEVDDTDTSERLDAFSRVNLSDLEIPEEDARKNGNRISLQSRLKYANLSRYPVYLFSLLQILVSLVAFVLARIYLQIPLQMLSLTFGPIIVNWLINRRITARSQRFDVDFPQFLLSVVGMLKTGLNSFQALQAASEGLEKNSLVRQEVALMLERLRVGVTEDRSIGSFAEDVLHPEVELFVQAVILSRRVGGTLSDTLDRLSKQARKRQNFRMAASSTVAQQRGSIWVIILIIFAVQVYMYHMSPEMVLGAWSDPNLRVASETALVVIFMAIWWMNKITRLKI